MYLASVLCLVLFPGLAFAFSGGWFPVAHSTSLHKRSKSQIGRFLGNNLDSARSIGDAGTSNTRRAAPRKLRAFPNEYEVFFNKASKSGAASITTLTPEERAQRALEVQPAPQCESTPPVAESAQGEKLEDEIIEIATVLREKADKMVADSGAINFDVIQPLIDEIAVLKGKYKLVVGAVPPDDKDEDEESSC